MNREDAELAADEEADASANSGTGTRAVDAAKKPLAFRTEACAPVSPWKIRPLDENTNPSSAAVAAVAAAAAAAACAP